MSWLSTIAIGLALAGAGTLGSGLLRLLAAGRAERHGQLNDARMMARESVPLTGLGALGSLAALLLAAVASPVPRPGMLATSLAALALAGGTGVLAGLSGKPRPSAGFAWILLLCGAGLATIAFVARTP